MSTYPTYGIKCSATSRRHGSWRPTAPARALRLALALSSGLAVLLLLAAAPALASEGGAPPEEPTTGLLLGCLEVAPRPNEEQVCGTLNPHSSAKVNYHFAYNVGSSCANGYTTPDKEAEGEGIEVYGRLSELMAHTQYTYCLVATNAYGETPSHLELTFATQPEEVSPPETPITESCGAQVQPRSQQLCGKLNPIEDAWVRYRFAYNAGASCTGGASSPEEFRIWGQQNRPVSYEALELIPSTQYAFCLVAMTERGEETYGSTVTFTTAGEAPVVGAESASSITQTAATLQAQIDPHNQATGYSFKYATGESLAGAAIVPGGHIAAGMGSQQVSVPVVAGALAPDTTYYYQATATNATGTQEGPVESFTTPALVPPIVVVDEGPGGGLGGGSGGGGSGLGSPGTTPTAPVGSPPPIGAPVSTPKVTANARRLAAALRVCRAKPPTRRARCTRDARAKYGVKALGGRKASRKGRRKQH